jgi:S-disulfanyl-L-cysteine oxidoreductase SoxD
MWRHKRWSMVIGQRSLVGRAALLGLIVLALTVHATAGSEDQRYGIGQPASEPLIRPWNIDIAPSGEGLPPGRGTARQGAVIYAKKCAGCHGPTGVEGPNDRLIGGQGSLQSQEPVKTVGSYWPYATTLYDYINRAMPFTAPQSLTPDEVYSLVAWILARNGIVPDNAVMDQFTLPKVGMSNRDGFVPDPRPDIPNVPQ